ncbi:hypothetical protein LINPERPRIM_LOCUS16901, partial [Linum perenne]
PEKRICIDFRSSDFLEKRILRTKLGSERRVLHDRQTHRKRAMHEAIDPLPPTQRCSNPHNPRKPTVFLLLAIASGRSSSPDLSFMPLRATLPIPLPQLPLPLLPTSLHSPAPPLGPSSSHHLPSFSVYSLKNNSWKTLDVTQNVASQNPYETYVDETTYLHQ